MFGKTGKKQNQEKQQAPEISGHQEADLGGIGNEALSHYLENDINLLKFVPHKAKNGKKGSPDTEKAAGTVLSLLNEIVDKDPDAGSEIKENIKKENENVPEDIAAEGLSGYYLNDLNRHPPKARKTKKKKKDSGNIMNDDLISEKSDEKEPDLLSIGSRRSSLSMQNGIGDDQSEISDLEEAGNDMEPVDG